MYLKLVLVGRVGETSIINDLGQQTTQKNYTTKVIFAVFDVSLKDHTTNCKPKSFFTMIMLTAHDHPADRWTTSPRLN